MREALTADTITIKGDGGDEIEAYLATPLGDGPFPGVVVLHHMPGYDPATKEITRAFAANGYAGLCPNLYSREAPGESFADAYAKVRALGGVPDDRLVGDVVGAADHLRALPHASGKIGVIGFCSGGRQAFLAACSTTLDAAVDCYGAFVVSSPPESLGLKMRSIVHLTKDLSCPLLGIFGADDAAPTPEEVDQLAAALTEQGKDFEFEVFEGAGHAFLSTDRPNYRPEAAAQAWPRIWGFLERHLGT
jgi:carboxymethylenebutenolidase